MPPPPPDRAGRFIEQNPGSPGSYHAFVPAPLPPVPPLELDTALRDAEARANLAVGRLDGSSRLLPDLNLFLYMYVRKEAVLSSQIEGTQSSLSDLLLFEDAGIPAVPVDDRRTSSASYSRTSRSSSTTNPRRRRRSSRPASRTHSSRPSTPSSTATAVSGACSSPSSSWRRGSSMRRSCI